jgi:hypothetical protein
MTNVKTDKEVIPTQTGGSENNATATPKDAAGSTQATLENPEQGGGNAPEQKNTEVDKGGKKTPTGKKRISKEDANANEAKKIFKKFAVEELYFTSDGFGFLNQKGAEYHGASLKDQKVTKINKKDVE